MRDRKELLLKAGGVLFWLIVWHMAAVIINKPVILVTPLAALKRLWALMGEGDFFKTILNSALRFAAGYLAAAVTGICAALLSVRFSAVGAVISPLMTAVKSVPVASFIIFALFWMKSRDLSLFIVFLIVLPVIYGAVKEGIESTDRELLEMARIFRFGLLKKLRYIYFPSVMPFLTAACATSAGLAFKSGTAAEVIGQPDFTLGDKLFRSKIYLETADLFAWTAVIIITGEIFERITIIILKLIYKFSQKVNIK